QVGRSAGYVLALAAMALRLHDWLAFGHIAHLAAIASAFQLHGVLPSFLPPAVSPAVSCSGDPFLPRHKKKGAPTCAGAPQRSGHCRVCAQTVVLGAVLTKTAPREVHML